MLKKLLRYSFMHRKYDYTAKTPINFVRHFRISLVNNADDSNRALVQTDPFEKIEQKNKNTYLEMVKIYVRREEVHRRNHVEFVYAALKNMEQFGVNKDLEVYKSLIDVLPKGKFIPSNLIQAEFMHYPKQQQCIIDLLEQMEDNGVMPDAEMEPLLLNIFGKQGFPLRRYWRMMYWMPKFKNLSPWPVPEPLPKDTFELAKYAIERISSADETSDVKVYWAAEIQDSIDDTWIVSAQSPTQKRIINEHNVEEPIFVEGAFKVHIKGNAINYFILRAEPKPQVEEDVDLDNVSNLDVSLFQIKPPIGKHLKKIPSVHEQDDGVILALCATGTSSKDSLLSWIRHLERDGNPNLGTIPVVFKLGSSTKDIATVGDSAKSEKIEDK